MLYTIFEPDYNPLENMVRDKQLLELSLQYDAAFLRIYSWAQPTISLGRLQKKKLLINLDIVQTQKIPVITRPTGGRTVLHSNEITYAFAFHTGLAEKYGTTVNDTYCLISKLLIKGLANLGVSAQLAQQPYSRTIAKNEQKLPCFLSAVPYEIEVEGKKLIGSAQLRHKNGVLQHGSIPLDDSFMGIVQYERNDEQLQKKRLLLLQQKSTSLQGALGTTISFKQGAQALFSAFSSWEKSSSFEHH